MSAISKSLSFKYPAKRLFSSLIESLTGSSVARKYICEAYLWGSADIVFYRRMSALGRITLEGFILQGLVPFRGNPGSPTSEGACP
ncbi:MAG: hypothetical protein ACTSUS_05355, partial [Candidatus Freyarchaeota archaeon]